VEHASSITRSRVRTTTGWREHGVRGAQLLAVSGFALAQPLFDILGKNAEFFAVRGSTPSDIVLFALAVTFVPAVVLLLIEVTVGLLTERGAVVLHHVFLAGLAAVFGAQALKRSGVDGATALIAGAVLIGLAVAVAAWRLSIARQFLTILGAAPLVFLALFLFNSKVEQLVFPGTVNASAATVDSSTPVVYLLFDEFPVIDLMKKNGDIDAKRFPNFARLERSSTWFRNTSSLSATTTQAVPAILTGNPPIRGALPTAENYPNNLFTLLGSRYRMVVTESQTKLCPSQICKRKATSAESRLSSLYRDARIVYLHLLAPPSLEDRLPVIDESWGNFGADTGGELIDQAPKVNKETFYIGRVRNFNRFVKTFRAPKTQPTLYFLHFLMPHGPWLYAPDGKVRAVARSNAPGRVDELWTSGDLAEQAWQRHLLQTGYTDRLLGRFMRRLRAVGLWDRALVVVGPDHGISFRGGDLRRDPTRTNLSELAFIPFFVKVPGQKKGRIVDTHITIVDILPTIADVLGVEIPWETAGRSAFAVTEDRPLVRVGTVEAPYPEALAQRRRSLARQLGLFGSGAWNGRLAGTGRYRGLVGRPVPVLDVRRTPDGEAVVDKIGSKLLRSLPKRSPLFPSPLAGYLSRSGEGEWVALALNGRIAAVSHTYTFLGKLRFSMLASDTSFRPGRNEARMFVVSGPTANPVFRELRVKLT
jgi:hypothetical protein